MARFPRDCDPDSGRPFDVIIVPDDMPWRVTHNSPSWPSPDEPPGCPYHERCRKSLGLPPELMCGFGTIWLGETPKRPGWTSCPKAQEYDAVRSPQEVGDDK